MCVGRVYVRAGLYARVHVYVASACARARVCVCVCGGGGGVRAHVRVCVCRGGGACVCAIFINSPAIQHSNDPVLLTTQAV